ncbi:hypothetical protein G5714_004409 [Onychostoma macrolepis]|uniref:Uncharacterized protein n=1 Tax=Onychostoma macrolepis TaxID=369639 RepID=A0A7J6D4N0_9TELE|nr:hypothetical protein G5714_004409 [Onychostoma macrolepis]
MLGPRVMYHTPEEQTPEDTKRQTTGIKLKGWMSQGLMVFRTWTWIQRSSQPFTVTVPHCQQDDTHCPQTQMRDAVLSAPDAPLDDGLCGHLDMLLPP